VERGELRANARQGGAPSLCSWVRRRESGGQRQEPLGPGQEAVRDGRGGGEDAAMEASSVSLLPDRGWERAHGRSTSLAPATFWGGDSRSAAVEAAAVCGRDAAERGGEANGRVRALWESNARHAFRGQASMRWVICGWRLAVGGWGELARLDSLGQRSREKPALQPTTVNFSKV
jgi:hypothetical protein